MTVVVVMSETFDYIFLVVELLNLLLWEWLMLIQKKNKDNEEEK
jgi:hypothetical protein